MRVLKLIFGLILLSSTPTQAEVARIAVAANFRAAAQALAAQFETETHHTLTLSAGSTGQLYAQIRNGAPFDVFLSADQLRPERLIAHDDAIADSQFTYAIGRLYLGVRHPVSTSQMPLELTGIHRLSIANPATAPYGAAAEQVLGQLAFPEGAPLIAQAQSISGVNAALAAGAVDAGFVAYASVAQQETPSMPGWLVPDHLHDPIRQDAVLLKRGADNPAAIAFLAWLRVPAAQHVIRQSGYHVD